MPFDRPTLGTLRRQAATDINAALPGVDALLRYSNLGILGDVQAAMTSGHYGYLDWIARQSVPFTATGEYLEGWAALKGVTRKPATPAKGAARFVAAVGTEIPAGTTLTRSDGVTYRTTDAASVADGAVTVAFLADVAGAAGNADAGVTLFLGAALPGVASTGAAVAAITGGAAVEEDANLRTRMLAAYASPPQGGSITDYPGWALEVPGVTRAWIKPGAMGPGTVAVYFMMDQAQAAKGGFPQGTNGCAAMEARDTAASGDQLAVADAIFLKQPVTALVYAVAPTANALTLTIANLGGLTDERKAAVAAAVRGALFAGAVPGGVTHVAAIEAAISATAGTAGFVLTGIAATAGTVGNGGIGNISSNAGALPVLGGIVWA
ncbi:baseplate J/gp47 family protein [Sphingomonas sp. S-NIH.Pt15_0812]|uniref:baseplate J/gp47 family protein n=1 Tax=Sphingomonas sp. S-NIH.Pt15_0812 TaxID=1920129 RepID=UPI000F7EF3F8|nr:baseplate J/gp47 family protein [Sphingomonas sp. S-NIH.Pt15_0812]RSU46351.1 phage baseplate protein [Sphingomonas sp. S-NIH.Pt15_0812]